MLKVSSFSTETHSKSSSPLIRRLVKNRLFKIAPDIDEPLFQFIHIMDPVSLPSGRLEKTTRSSPHHVAQHHPTGSETTPPHAPRSSRFGSELPSVEDDVDVMSIVSCMPETTTLHDSPLLL